MSQYVVYIDVLLTLNFCLDFLLLAASGRCLRRHFSLPRLLLAATLGAVYGAAIVLPPLAPLYLPPAAVLVSLGLLLIAYPFGSAAAFLKLAGTFYLVAFAMAGSALAAASFVRQQGYSLGGMEAVEGVALLAAVPVALIVGRRGFAALRRGWRQEDFQAQLVISVNGRSLSLIALIDTGSDLVEPLTRRPVVVADQRSLWPLLPERLRQAWLDWGDQPDLLIERLSRQPDLDGWSRRLRLIPYASIGRKNGLLLGFRPDSVTLIRAGKRSCGPAVIAIAALGGEQKYQAVVNPALLDAMEVTAIKEASA